jgi:hypothetical protein
LSVKISNKTNGVNQVKLMLKTTAQSQSSR